LTTFHDYRYSAVAVVHSTQAQRAACCISCPWNWDLESLEVTEMLQHGRYEILLVVCNMAYRYSHIVI